MCIDTAPDKEWDPERLNRQIYYIVEKNRANPNPVLLKYKIECLVLEWHYAGVKAGLKYQKNKEQNGH